MYLPKEDTHLGTYYPGNVAQATDPEMQTGLLTIVSVTRAIARGLLGTSV